MQCYVVNTKLASKDETWTESYWIDSWLSWINDYCSQLNLYKKQQFPWETLSEEYWPKTDEKDAYLPKKKQSSLPWTKK